MKETVNLSLPRRWANFLRWAMGLCYGRHVITLTIGHSWLDFSAQYLGEVKVERDRSN